MYYGEVNSHLAREEEKIKNVILSESIPVIQQGYNKFSK